MALVVADRVQETTTTTGTGTYTLAGAKAGFQSFAPVGDGNTTYYACTDGTDYEVGIGTYTATGTTLARTTIIESSNSDAAVNWGAGSKDIFVTSPADKTLLVGRNLYVDNPSSATMPSATGANAISIGSNAGSTGTNGIAIGTGADVLNSRSDGIAIGTNAGVNGNDSIAIGENALTSSGATAAISIGRNSDARAAYSIAIGYTADAGTSSTRSTSIGYLAKSSGDDAVALGYSYVDEAGGFAAVIGNNTVSYGSQGANSIAMGYLSKATGLGNVNIGYDGYSTGTSGAVAIGYRARATGTNAISLGQSGYTTASGTEAFASGYAASAAGDRSIAFGRDNTVSSAGDYGLAIGGNNNSVTGSSGVVVGGNSNEASNTHTFATGHYAKAAEYGKVSRATGRFSATGDAQGGQFILRADTTDATATVLTADNSTASSTNQIVAASDTCITFDGTITAMQNGAQAYASWKIEGLLVNDGGTTTLANSATTVIQNLSSWGMALSADNTNNALAITCTGEAAHNIRWVANIRTSEVTYA